MVHGLDDLLDNRRVALLRQYDIREIADLVGALQADHDSIGRLLDLDRRAVSKLHQRAVRNLPRSVRESLEQASPGMGAWDPNADQ